MEKILLVDDEKNYHIPLTGLFNKEGYDVLSAYNIEQAWEVLKSGTEISLVLTDMTMPGGSGIELLGKMKNEFPEIPVVMITAYGTVELAVEAMKLGAYDYLTKPFKSDEILRVINKAIGFNRLGRQNKELKTALKERYSFGNLIGKSKPMQNLYNLLAKVAPTKVNVLITGESGTGKELVAQALHYNSLRKDNPFIAVNCSALSASLLESELFGHEKGAFTDAKATKRGRFELADTGSLFLDEIGEIDQSIQVKLLRVLQERTFERVGGTNPINIDVRLIAATNRDLKQEVINNRFREDLFYRLNVVHLELPPLRDRLDDLPILTEHFLNKFLQDSARENIKISQEALRCFYNYSWPGNVRELENVIERGLVLASGNEIFPKDLPDDLRKAVKEKIYTANTNSANIELQTANTNSANIELQTANTNSANIELQTANTNSANIELQTANTNSNNIEIKAANTNISNTNIETNTANTNINNTNIETIFKSEKLSENPEELLVLDTENISFHLTEEDWLVNLKNKIPPNFTLGEAVAALEESLMRLALNELNNVQSHAAGYLGLKKNVFKYKWDKYNTLEESSELIASLAKEVPRGIGLVEALDTFEEYLLKKALIATSGVQSQAAELLGIKRNLMQYKLKKFGLR